MPQSHAAPHAVSGAPRALNAVFRAFVIAMLASATTLPSPLAAQTAAGVGDDANALPRHTGRIRIGGIWSGYDSRFAPTADGGSKKSGLFDGHARESFGAADNPVLSSAQDNIRALSGLSNFNLSLGRLDARGDVSKSITPLQIEYGLFSRLSISLLVPYVETTANNRFTLNSDTAAARTATVGRNPARNTASARTNNTTLVSQIAGSRTALIAEIARCGNPAETGGGCEAIRANPAAANALLTQASQLGAQISQVYGTSAVVGSPVVPVLKSAAQTAIEQQIANLRNSFTSYASNQLDAALKPSAAITIYGTSTFYGTEDVLGIARDSAFGLAYDTLAHGGRAGIGDVEATATLLVFNSLGNSQYDRLNLSRKGVRTTVTGGWRFGTATGGRSGNPFDLPTGDGANAVLVRSSTDLVWSRRFWISGTVRYAKPLADEVVTRYPMTSDTNLFRPSLVYASERKLGARAEFEIAPRVGLGRAFGLSMAYGFGRQSASTLTALNPLPDVGPTIPIATTYTTSAITVQTLQFGASYSTLNGFVRGKSRWPLEVIYSHGLTLAGSGGVVPAEAFDRVELRIYTRFPRR